MALRAALLKIVDAIEEYLDMQRTKELRRIAKGLDVAQEP